MMFRELQIEPKPDPRVFRGVWELRWGIHSEYRKKFFHDVQKREDQRGWHVQEEAGFEVTGPLRCSMGNSGSLIMRTNKLSAWRGSIVRKPV